MTHFHWIKINPRMFALDHNMGEIWETLYDGWYAAVKVNGVATRLFASPDPDSAKQLVEDYWRAAWEMKPKTSGDQEPPTRSGS